MAIFNTEYAHWHQFFEGLSVSPVDFYQSLERQILESKLPETQTVRIDFLERGLLSSKRIYLKIKRDWLTYHVCAAPFGTGFFVSSRLITDTWNSWPLLVVPLIFCPMIPVFVYLFFVILSKSMLVAIFLAFMSIPPSCLLLLAVFILWYMHCRITYYRLDTMAAFQEAVHGLLVKEVNRTIESAGRKPMSVEESKPVLHKLLKR